MNERSEQIQLGTYYDGGNEAPFCLELLDRRHPTYVIGKTGAGKTTLVGNMMDWDIRAGRGVGFFDPHGDESEARLHKIPPDRIHDVVYFNAADLDFRFSFNLFAGEKPAHRHLAASAIVSVLRGMWSEFWGPRIEHILYATVAALLEVKGASLLGVPRILTDEDFRRSVVEQVQDLAVGDFWTSEFEWYDRRFVVEAIAPIQNKVGQLLMSPEIRNVLGQSGRSISARQIMDEGKIFIANLSKGKIGADKANLLGALLISEFQLAALSRADIPEAERKDFYLFVDEFHSFVTDSFTTLLSEARKYRLCVVLAHQYLDQLKPPIAKAVLGNAGSIFAFRVGHSDAEILAKSFGDEYPANHFSGLGNYEVCAKLLQDGKDRPAFTGWTHPPQGTFHGLREDIIANSRRKYAEPRHIVEHAIARWIRYGEFDVAPGSVDSDSEEF